MGPWVTNAVDGNDFSKIIIWWQGCSCCTNCTVNGYVIMWAVWLIGLKSILMPDLSVINFLLHLLSKLFSSSTLFRVLKLCSATTLFAIVAEPWSKLSGFHSVISSLWQFLNPLHHFSEGPVLQNSSGRPLLSKIAQAYTFICLIFKGKLWLVVIVWSCIWYTLLMMILLFQLSKWTFLCSWDVFH